MKVLLWMPTMGSIPTSMARYIFSMPVPVWVELIFYTVDRLPHMASRNEIIKAGIVQQADYIWFLDDDNVPLEKDTLARLLSHNQNIVSWLVPSRKPDNEGKYRYCVFKLGFSPNGISLYDQYMKQPQDWLIEVATCGMGCVIIHKSVFKPVYERWGGMPCEMWMKWYYAIDWQWIMEDFVDVYNLKDWQVRFRKYLSEDLSFFERAKYLLDERIYCDTTVKCTHIGDPVLILPSFVWKEPSQLTELQ